MTSRSAVEQSSVRANPAGVHDDDDDGNFKMAM